MRAARLLVLQAARPRSGQLAAARSEVAISAAPGSYNALRASTLLRPGTFNKVHSTHSVPALSATGATALAAGAAASHGRFAFGLPPLGPLPSAPSASASPSAPRSAHHTSTRISSAWELSARTPAAAPSSLASGRGGPTALPTASHAALPVLERAEPLRTAAHATPPVLGRAEPHTMAGPALPRLEQAASPTMLPTAVRAALRVLEHDKPLLPATRAALSIWAACGRPLEALAPVRVLSAAHRTPGFRVPSAQFSTSSASAVGSSTVNAADLQALKKPLAFVNRYAEALDVLVPNLANQESLRDGSSIKFTTPLAAQPPGTGKTDLGRNITAILRRPRETDAAVVASVAERLRSAWCWEGGPASAVDAALADPRNENLVVRTLLAHFPDHEETILRLKRVEPLIIEMKGLVTPRFGLDFDGALAYAIFCSSRGLDGSADETETAFLAQRKGRQSAVGAVKTLLRERGIPVMLVLDDITDLAEHRFSAFFGDTGKSPLHSAMTELRVSLQLLHGIPGCFVYCTGRSLWLSSQALIGSGSPLIMQPALLQPLSPGDILQTLQSTKAPSGRSLLDSLAIAPELVGYFASRTQALTGGIGRALQFLLRARQRECSVASPVLQSRSEVDDALDRLMLRLAKIPGVQLRVTWDGPADAAAAKEVPLWVQQRDEQVRLLQLFARMLLLDASFLPDFDIELGGEKLRLSDAAVVLGLSYGPAPAPDGSAVAAAPISRTHLRLIAGEWLCRSLQREPSIMGNLAVLSSVQLLSTMRSFGGTMRGRPFEMLCADALCFRSLLRPNLPLGELLPHLSRSLRGKDVVPALRVIALPKAVRDDHLSRLDEKAKAELLRSREHWTGAVNVHADDLPWILLEWLPVGALGIPADAQSGSQDFFLKLVGGIIGFALKAASASAGTDWNDLRDELGKVPFPPGVPYTLVLWSLNLAPQLRAAMGTADAAVFGKGVWKFRGDTLVRARKNPSFVVADKQELVVVNPHAPSGGGLVELLGSSVFSELASMSHSTGRLLIAHLVDWMAKAVVNKT